MGSPEINSHQRQREWHMKFNNLHKKDIAHSSYRDDPWKETKYINTMHNRYERKASTRWYYTITLQVRVREEQIHFWFCWCFSPTGPMHLISALSLWAGTLRAKPGRVLQLPDSTKWTTWIYEHKHTEQVTANAALRTAGQTKNMGDTVSRGADVKVRTWIKWRTGRMNTVRSLVKKT